MVASGLGTRWVAPSAAVERAGRLLFQLILDEFKDALTANGASSYMQLAVYDLIGEIFPSSD
jgi:hypothetical protein